MGHNLSQICQLTSEDIKHQLINMQMFGEIPFVKLQNDT